MTNPALNDMVKIGYATNVEERRKQLSTTALPYEYEIYATYETSGNLEDKTLHKLIDKLNPDLRVSKNREFYIMSPEDAYGLLEAIKHISGSPNALLRYNKRVKPETKSETKKENRTETQEIKSTGTQVVKKPPINFRECGIPISAELVFIEDETIKVKVCGDRKVLYKDEETSLSSLVQDLKHLKQKPQGTAYFTYNGKPLLEIAEETQWRK